MPDTGETPVADDDAPISQTQVAQIIEEFESDSPMRKLSGLWAWVAGLLSSAVAIYALYWTQYSVTTQAYRAIFLALVLVLTFLLYPSIRHYRDRVQFDDIILAILAVIALVYLALTFRSALQRVTQPTAIEMTMGGLLILLVLEATRRTTGWALTLVALTFMAYAYFGPS